MSGGHVHMGQADAVCRVCHTPWCKHQAHGHMSMAAGQAHQHTPVTAMPQLWAAPHGTYMRMITVEPPPPKPSNNGDPTTIPTIVNLAHNLCDLLFKILLPKTRNTKTAPITLEVLHHAWDLITSVATLLHEHPRESNLSNISKQLDAVTTRLGTLNKAQVAQPLTPKTQSYASVLATGVQCPELLNYPPPCTRVHFNLTLTLLPKSHVTTQFSRSCQARTCLTESMQPSGRWNAGMRFALCRQTQRVVLSSTWHHASGITHHNGEHSTYQRAHNLLL